MTLVSPIDLSGPKPGGTRRYVLDLAGRLHGRGVGVAIVARGDTASPLPGVEYVQVPSGPRGESFLVGLCLSAGRLPIPQGSIIHAQRPDTLAAFSFAHRASPKVCTLHGIPNVAVRRRGVGYGLAYSVAERFGLWRAQRVIAVSQDAARWYSSRFPDLEPRMRVIPVAVDTDRFHPMNRETARRRFRVEAEHVLLFAGRLAPEKRVDRIIGALGDLGETELLIAGDGPEEGRLRVASRDLPVRFLGIVATADMPVLLNAADVLVLASEYEGLPTVALEALACGVPVFSTEVGGLPEIVSQGETGWLVPPSLDLGDALAEALLSAQGMRDSCVEAGKSFSWEVVLERILAVYRELEAAS